MLLKGEFLCCHCRDRVSNAAWYEPDGRVATGAYPEHATSYQREGRATNDVKLKQVYWTGGIDWEDSPTYQGRKGRARCCVDRQLQRRTRSGSDGLSQLTLILEWR